MQDMLEAKKTAYSNNIFVQMGWGDRRDLVYIQFPKSALTDPLFDNSHVYLPIEDFLALQQTIVSFKPVTPVIPVKLGRDNRGRFCKL